MADEGSWGRVGKAVTERMTERGLQIEDLAHDSGLTRATIREIRQGRPRQRPTSTLTRVSLALGWTASSLQQILDGGQPDELEYEMRSAASTAGLIERLRQRQSAPERPELTAADYAELNDRLTRVEQILLRLLGEEAAPGPEPRPDPGARAGAPLRSRVD